MLLACFRRTLFVFLLAGIAEAEHLVLLTWAPSVSPNVAGYRVYRRQAPSTQFTLLTPTLVLGTSYVDHAVQASQTYVYTTTAVDGGNNESAHSNESQAVIPPPSYAGLAESVSCSAGITGWAADRDRLNQSISVTLWNGSTQIASVLANSSRPDIGASLGDNGLHGFRIPIPTAYADGVSRLLQVRFESSSTPLGASPVTIQCGGGTSGGGGGGTATPIYAGFTDSVSCSTGISGWAADRNRLNQAINVTLWDGATQVSTVLANGSRSDVASVLGDNGLHGFKIPIPAAYANGAARTLQVRYETSTTQLPLSPVTFTCGGGGAGAGGAVTPVYSGYVDSASCAGILGWAADRTRLNQSINVSLWDGNTQITSSLANSSRGDVGTLLGDNGLHGYRIPIPAAYANGVSHTLQVRYESSSVQLPSSPVTISCGSAGSTSTPVYAGFVDAVSCNGIVGWAADRNRLNQSITVSLWDGNTQVASALANAARGDVGAALGDNGLHGYTLLIPAGYKNGLNHTLQVRYETSTTQLPLSPATFSCGSAGSTSTPVYAGYVDSAACNGIMGWAADRNRLNQSITVSLWDGNTQIASALANSSRGDVGAVLGDNGLHGYRIPIPAAYANGASHTLQVRYETSSTQLPLSPVTIKCGAATLPGTPNYTGWVDSSSCLAISGWAADRSLLNQPISVDLAEGSNVLATVLASTSRLDVGAVLGDNGIHGFLLVPPASLQDGAVHSIQVRYAGTTTALPNSPQTMQCSLK